MSLKSNKGFFLLDAVFSFSLTLSIILLSLPILQQIKFETSILDTRQLMMSALYSELQIFLEDSSLSKQFLIINQIPAEIKLNEKEDNWYGCIYWTNIRNEQEKVCLLAPKN